MERCVEYGDKVNKKIIVSSIDITHQIDTTLDVLIPILQKYREELGNARIDIDVDTNLYNDLTYNINLWYEREETDKEYRKRIKIEERTKKTNKERAQKKIEYEKKMYEKLHKKYGNP